MKGIDCAGTPALPSWLWLWAPLLFLLTVPAAFIFSPNYAQDLIGSENGVTELATPAILLVAIFSGIRCYALRRRLPERWLLAWLLLTTVACIYFAGEEISWGQQFFHWQTPDAISRINDQNETNLHNMSSWLDQKPRLLLALGILWGGIVLPLWRRKGGINYNRQDWRYWFWPDYVCMPVALLAFIVRFPERYANLFGAWLFDMPFRTSELQEFYFAYFLMLYLMSCYSRLARV